MVKSKKADQKGQANPAEDIEESQEELELFLIDEESLVNLTNHVAGLEYMVHEIRNEHDHLKEQLAELERRVKLARYN